MGTNWSGEYDFFPLSRTHMEDMKFAFQLSPPDQPGTVFFANSKPDKNEWVAALTHLLTRRQGEEAGQGRGYNMIGPFQHI